MEEELGQLLKDRQTSQPRRSWRCADGLELAAYVDGTLHGKARQSLETHLADCKICRSQVSFLMHTSGWPESVDIPPWLLAKAKNLVANPRKPGIAFGLRWATATFAAVLVVAFLILLVVQLRNSNSTQGNSTQSVAQQENSRVVTPSANSSPHPDAVAMASPQLPQRVTGQNNPSPPLLRNDDKQIDSPKLLVPRDGAIMKRASLEFRWQAVADAVFYEISIVTASGETVMSRQTEKALLKLPPDVQLLSGTKYFASVRAHLRDGKTVRSGIVSFRLSE